jgi:hypothetical protein
MWDLFVIHNNAAEMTPQQSAVCTNKLSAGLVDFSYCRNFEREKSGQRRQ